jgi:hypothetical protein
MKKTLKNIFLGFGLLFALGRNDAKAAVQAFNGLQFNVQFSEIVQVKRLPGGLHIVGKVADGNIAYGGATQAPIAAGITLTLKLQFPTSSTDGASLAAGCQQQALLGMSNKDKYHVRFENDGSSYWFYPGINELQLTASAMPYLGCSTVAAGTALPDIQLLAY